MKIAKLEPGFVTLDDGSRVPRSQVRKVEVAPAKASAASDGEPVKFFAYELEAGIATINEIRASKGLGPDGRFGNMTFPEYKAANPRLFQVPPTSTGERAADVRANGDANLMGEDE